MLSYRFSSNSIFYKFIIFLFVAFVLNCGLALGYQAEEEAAKASQENDNSPILAALGLSAGGGSSGIVSFSVSSLSFSATGVGSGTYTITVPSWPVSGSTGQIDLTLTWSGTMACSNPSPSSFSFADDQQYPVTSSTITFACGKPGSGAIDHTIINAPSAASSLIGTSVGSVSITVSP
ncbi:hypothetical protein [Leptospira saintgironsiae]|uniref:Uncharacterized protein n=1 Tax=Leptospira saintgironsiae TaxID=2023183 RepID=A0A2M9YBS0_9LEPT|nr:hypothetical protein [Leptospira saintgironsiae]PJZ48992.1 hypothetical protein CH362_11145 [Leptospira saintgironsiae]